MRFAGTGDQLLLESNHEPWLIQIELDGGAFTRRFVTEGTDTTSVVTSLGWNPNGHADWITYTTSPTDWHPFYTHPRFWNRLTGQSFDVDAGQGPITGWAWSRDGRFLFVASGNDQRGSDYYLQEVREGELGGNWKVGEIGPAEESRIRLAYFQP
jgi:hypothetical protein